MLIFFVKSTDELRDSVMPLALEMLGNSDTRHKTRVAELPCSESSTFESVRLSQFGAELSLLPWAGCWP